MLISRLLLCALAWSAFVVPAGAQDRAGPHSNPRDPLHPSYSPRVDGGRAAAVSPTGAASVWITGPLEKVHKDAAAGTQQSLQISAARNEFESFQVHVLAGTSAVQMNVTVGDFVNSQTGDVIASASNVFVYREAYLNITKLSDANGTLGMTPDPLIPTKDPYLGQARTAFPVSVPAGEVQSAWIDVLVPANARSGYYSATVTVMDGGSVLAQLSVVLKVWTFTLPSTATLKSAFGMSWNGLCVQAYGSYSNCGQYPGSGGSPDLGIELTHISQAILALDHRISISGVPYYGPPVGDWNHFDSTYGALMNGSAATLLAGAKLTTLQYTVGGALNASAIQDWVAHFTSAGWLAALFQYTCDEPPNGCSWSDALAREQAVHQASPDMKTLITTNIDNANQNGLLSDLNIIVPIVNDMDPQGGSNQRATYDSWLAGTNKHLWWYQSCSSHGSCSNGTAGSAQFTWPSYMVDATAVRNRVFQWLAFLDRIEGELYYETDYCFVGIGGSPCDSTDPWTSIYAFGGNGDGTLYYPGTLAKIGGTTPVPVPSIRLKHIRDGMEDFEYLAALSNAGYDALARSIAATFITNAYTFDNNPQALAAAREALGDRLHLLALPSCFREGVCAHDLNGDGFSDIVWRDGGGTAAAWLMNGTQVLQSGSFGTVPMSWQIVGQRDFDGDGKYDWLWRDSTGTVAIWLMSGLQVLQSGVLGTVPGSWTIAGTGDFNGDGKGDLLWRDASGTVAIWLMNGLQVTQSGGLGTVPGSWAIAGTGDFNGDGKTDILWRDSSGTVAIWLMNGLQVLQTGALAVVPANWIVAGTGDFNGDGKSDILWRDTSSGTVAIWLLNGLQVSQSGGLGIVPGNWIITSVGDFNSDGKSDLLWRDTSAGTVATWFMNGLQVSSSASVAAVGTSWIIQGVNAD
jgi:hypothetical protein